MGYLCGSTSSEKVCGFRQIRNERSYCYDPMLKRKVFYEKPISQLGIEDKKVIKETWTKNEKEMQSFKYNNAAKKRRNVKHAQLLNEQGTDTTINLLRMKNDIRKKLNRPKSDIEHTNLNFKQKQQTWKETVKHKNSKKDLLLRILSYYSMPHRYYGQYANGLRKKMKSSM